MLAKRTYKNQITIPQNIIKDFPGVEYFDVQSNNQSIILKPVSLTASGNLEAVREKMKKLGMTEKDLENAVTWARRKH